MAVKRGGLEFPPARCLNGLFAQRRVQVGLRHRYRFHHAARCIHRQFDIHCRGVPEVSPENSGKARNHLVYRYGRLRLNRKRRGTLLDLSINRRRHGNRWPVQQGESSSVHRSGTAGSRRLFHAQGRSSGGWGRGRRFEWLDFREGLGHCHRFPHHVRRSHCRRATVTNGLTRAVKKKFPAAGRRSFSDSPFYSFFSV